MLNLKPLTVNVAVLLGLRDHKDTWWVFSLFNVRFTAAIDRDSCSPLRY